MGEMMINKVMRESERERKRKQLTESNSIILCENYIFLLSCVHMPKHPSIYFKIYSIFINNHCTKIYVR